MVPLYPNAGVDSHESLTPPFDFDAPPLEVRLSIQERTRLAVSRHIDKDPEAYRARRRAYDNAKYVSDPAYRARKRQTRVLWHMMNGRRSRELPYTPDELRVHLEKLWLPGMSWDNYGDAGRKNGWQIDHIKPVSAFIKDGQVLCRVISALSNLRPLWKFENNSKHDKDAPTVPTYSKPRPIGEYHHLAKLNADKVRVIKARLRDGKYGVVSQLAREFGVNANTIQQIKDGKTWKGVE